MTKGKSFSELAESLPIVNDTINYVTDTYIDFKGKHSLLGAFLGGVERSVLRATYAAYHISKIVVPYDYFENIATEELKKVEENYPVIKKPTKQVWKECTTYTLSKISGVTSKKKIPTTLNEAVKIRVKCVAKTTKDYVAETGPMKVVAKFSHKIIDKVEEVIEKVIPDKKHKSKPKTKSEYISERISEIMSRTKAKLHEISKEIADLKGEPKKKEVKDMTYGEMIEASEHALLKLYNELRAMPQQSNILDMTKHYAKVVTTGSLHFALGSIHEFVSELEKLIAYLKERGQRAVTFVKESEHLVGDSYNEMKGFWHHSFETFKRINLRKIPSSIRRALEAFWKEITKSNISLISESLAAGARKHHHIEDADKMVGGGTSSEA